MITLIRMKYKEWKLKLALYTVLEAVAAEQKDTAALLSLSLIHILRTVLRQGFTYNGVHFSRFGKSASQGKDGITAFVCDSIFDELYRITQMDIPVDHCVIAKYEAQRCLAFSACSLVHDYMPNIVIIGEYEKTLPGQLIKYVKEREKELVDEETGKTCLLYTSRCV